ncbi:MAG: hypothetical protein WA966_14630 [Ornithinimicrobium sp.]
MPSPAEPTASDEVDKTVKLAKKELGDTDSWPPPVRLNGLGLCVMNAVYSTGNRSSAVVRVLDRYRDLRRERGCDPESDTPDDVIAEIERQRGPEGFADTLNNRWRAWQSRQAPYKTEVIYGAARLLQRSGVQTSDRLSLVLEAPGERDRIKAEWLALPGQRSGLTWRYFLMNAGVPGVKADRMIIRWISRAVERRVTARDAESILLGAAGRMGVDAGLLDHAVWAYQRRCG